MWKAVAEYANGTRIEKCFPYQERGIWTLENERQYDLECWLMEKACEYGDCTFYSVTFTED